MPEGPELLFFSVFLKKKLIKKKFIEIKSFTNKPVILPNDWNGNILDVSCKGKLLWLYVKGNNFNYYMHIHFGLTGWLTFNKPESNIKFELIFKKDNSEKEINLYMEDKRRFSKINIYNEKSHNDIIDKMGIDIFSDNFSLINFKNIIKNKNTFIAALLLKQDIFCGIGNYIKNEAMYLSYLKVKIKSSEITDTQITNLYNNILFVGYSNLIEMLSEYKLEKYLNNNKKNNMPVNIENPYKYRIYGLDFTKDGKKVIKIKVSGRDTYCIKELC